MTMPLTKLIDRYIDARNEERPIGHELSPQKLSSYQQCVQRYAVHIRRVPTVDDLAHESVNEFLAAHLKSGSSPYTVKNRRTHLLVLMRYAKCESLSTAEPDRVRRIRCPKLEIKGYTIVQMVQLLDAAAKLRGRQRRTGVSRRMYFVSLLLFMWNLGSRIGDVLLVETSKFDSVGRIWVYESKTRKSGWHRLHNVTTEAIAACIAENPNRKRIWPGYTRRNICRAFGELVAAAGVGGTSRFIRRGSSSALDRLQPGTGWRFLNHSGPQVFEDHYRDAEICGDESLSPPELPCNEAIMRICRPVKKEKPQRKERPEKPQPKYARPTDVPLTAEVRDSLANHPLTDAHLAVLVGHLTAHGISQTKLAEWWGVALKRYQDFRYGYRVITLQAADRLRAAFELPTRGAATDGPIALGSLVATPGIAALLNAEQLSAGDLKTVVDYAKQSLGVHKGRLALCANFSLGYLQQVIAGRFPATTKMQLQIRELFALDGDAA
jgi:integrase